MTYHRPCARSTFNGVDFDFVMMMNVDRRTAQLIVVGHYSAIIHGYSPRKEKKERKRVKSLGSDVEVLFRELVR